MLNQKQKTALNALMDGDGVINAGKKAGVSGAMVSRWKRLPEFKDALGKQRTDILDDIVSKLIPLVPAAVKAIKECLVDDNANVKIRAAGLVLDKIKDTLDTTELLDQIAALERKLDDIDTEKIRPVSSESQSDSDTDGSENTNSHSDPADDQCRPTAGSVAAGVSESETSPHAAAG